MKITAPLILPFLRNDRWNLDGMGGLHRHVVAAQNRRAGTGESRQRRWHWSY